MDFNKEQLRLALIDNINKNKEQLRLAFRDNIIKDNVEAFKLLIPTYILFNVSFITGFKIALDYKSFSIAKLIYQLNIKEENYIRDDLLAHKIEDLDFPTIEFVYNNKISIDNDSIINKDGIDFTVTDFTSFVFIRAFLYINKISKSFEQSKDLLKNLICNPNEDLEIFKIKLEAIFIYYTVISKSEIAEFLMEKLAYENKKKLI